jgi:peptide/nickel transport system permease protein
METRQQSAARWLVLDRLWTTPSRYAGDPPCPRSDLARGESAGMISASTDEVLRRQVWHPGPRARAGRGTGSGAPHGPAVVGAGVITALVARAVLAPWISPYQPGAIDLRHVAAPPAPAPPAPTAREIRPPQMTRVRTSRPSSSGPERRYVHLGRRRASRTARSRASTGRLDTLMMRAVDFVLSLPAIFVLLILALLQRGSVLNVILYIGLFGWMGMARLVRGQVLSLRERDFVLAARALGASNLRILVRHLAPNALAPVIVAVTLGVAGGVACHASRTGWRHSG